jgi:hypothetical protein
MFEASYIDWQGLYLLNYYCENENNIQIFTLLADLPNICSSISAALFSFCEPILFADFFKASSLNLKIS